MDGVTDRSERTPSPRRWFAGWGTGLPDSVSKVRFFSTWFDPGEPHPIRGPFSRWPRVADTTVAVVVFVASLIAVAVSALGDDEELTMASIGDLPVAAGALLAVAAAALIWRRARPLVVTGVVLVVMVAWAVGGYGDGQELALIVAAYSVGRYTADHGRSVAALAVIIAVGIIGTVIDAQQRVDIAPAVILTGLAWYVGRRVRNRGDYVALLQDRAHRLEAEQHAKARRAVAEERSRIARELHDVVAHRVSMMTVQAGAAKTIAAADLEAAVEAMGDVEREGRQALGELRHLLGVLRPETSRDQSTDDLGPQPGLDDVGALVEQFRHTNPDVNLTMVEMPENLPAAVELSAYRIIQESLTNVIKHAGPRPTVKIKIGLDGPNLAIDITNTINNTNAITDSTASTPGTLPSSGYGIAGMQERAQLLGGTLTATQRPDHHYCVQARLPLEPEPT